MLPALTAVNRLPGPGERAILPAMRNILRSFTITATLLTVATPLAAQTPQGVMGDLLRDVTQVEQKVVGLAKAIPATGYEWRPGKGVRSTGEVFMHIALANYGLVGITGPKPPVNLNPRLEKTVTRKAQVIEWLKGSLEFVKTERAQLKPADLDAPRGWRTVTPLWTACI